MQNEVAEHELTALNTVLLHAVRAEVALRRTAGARGVAVILVTRHDYQWYMVAVDEGVPFGETRQQSFL